MGLFNIFLQIPWVFAIQEVFFNLFQRMTFGFRDNKILANREDILWASFKYKLKLLII